MSPDNFSNEDIFKELASDEGIAQAASEHAAACSVVQQHGCPVCSFFEAIHTLRHAAEAFDAEKIVELTEFPAEFLADAMTVVRFLSEATQYFLDNLVAYDEEEEEEGDYDEE